MKQVLIFFLAFSAFFCAAQKPFERKGFFWGASVGGSSLALFSEKIGDQKQAGGSFPNLKFGAMIGPRTGLAVVLPGTVYRQKWGSGRERDRGFEGIVPSIQFWPRERFWLLAGAGLGMDAPAFYDIEDASERTFFFGGAALAGAGFELFRRGRLAIDGQFRAHFGSVRLPDERLKGAVFSVLIGVNFY